MLRAKGNILSQTYMIVDFFLIQIAFYFAWWFRFKSNFVNADLEHRPFEFYFPWSFVFGFIVLIIGFSMRLYSSKRNKKYSYECFKVIQIHVLSLLVLISLLFIFKFMDISRHFLSIFLISDILFVLIFRLIIKSILNVFRKKGYNKKFMLILGAGSLGTRFYENLRSYPEYGYEVVGFLDDFQRDADKAKPPIIGGIDALENVLESRMIDEVIIALPMNMYEKFDNIIDTCEKYGVRALIIPDFFDILPAKPYIENFAGLPILNIRDIPLDEFWNRLIKRIFDVVFSLIAIMLTSPILVVIAIGVKVTSPGPVVYKQERVGLNRRTFLMYKFRSMKALPPGVPDTGWTTANDPRKTKFGSFLRKTSLDELPQFFNVLFGHMSVVGPRPERPYYVDQFKEKIPKYMIKHHIRPGITGWAQSNGLRGDTSIEDRIKHDLFYIENWSFYFDVKIIVKTVFNGFVNKNAY